MNASAITCLPVWLIPSICMLIRRITYYKAEVTSLCHSPCRGDDGYQLGGILRITVRNFMTHSLIMAHPSPRLNLIIGPNGSGKSSIVCAICLGLGGEPKVSTACDLVEH